MLYHSIDERLASYKGLMHSLDPDRLIIPGEDLRGNITKNLVEVVLVEYEEPQNRTNGLLLTKDGWLLTAHHAVQDKWKKWTRLFANPEFEKSPIISQLATFAQHCYVVVDGREYPIDLHFLAGSQPGEPLNQEFKHDFMLMKAVLPGPPEPTRIKVAEGIQQFEPIEMAGYVDKKFTSIPTILTLGNRHDGYTRTVQAYELFFPDKAPHGMSGGALINEFGEYTGMITMGYFEPWIHAMTGIETGGIASGVIQREVQKIANGLVFSLENRLDFMMEVVARFRQD